MKAHVYHGPGRHSWDDVGEPTLTAATDAIVRVDAVTICGTDLHIVKGDVPDTAPGRILGHEAVGTVESTGDAVGAVRAGDRVLVSCISACGRCQYCRMTRYGQCSGGGGWVLGHTIDGTQAERVRVPFADNSLHAVPDEVGDEAALMLADIVPTAYEVGVLNGQVRPGDTVVVVGVGPVGLAAVKTATLFSPATIIAIDPSASRRDAALEFGATTAIDPSDDAVRRVRDATGGLGAHVAIEAVGVPETFELCVELIRAGGRVANVGVHGAPATLHLETLWSRDVTITTGLVDTFSTPTLMAMVANGALETSTLITHRFGIPEMLEAYDVFAGAADTGALKVVLFRV